MVERYAYTPYGEVTYLDPDFSVASTQSSTIGNEFLYTGRRLDPETGLQLNRYRFYHQQLGRWVNRDPIGYTGVEFNLYGYVDSQPTISIDPSGLSGKVRIILKLGNGICKVMDLSYEQAKKLLRSRVKDAQRPRNQRRQTRVFVNVKDEKAAKNLAEEVSPCGESAFHPINNQGHPPHYHPVKGHRPNGRPDTEGTPHIGCEYVGAGVVMVPPSESMIEELLNQGAELIIDLTPIVGDLQDLPELIATTHETITITYQESGRTVQLRCREGEMGIDRISKDKFGCEEKLSAGCWRKALPGGGK